MKVPQNCFDLFNCSNKSGMQISKFSFAQVSSKTDLKLSYKLSE